MFTLKKDIPQLYQWDSNVKLIVEDDRINQVQFSQRFSRTAVCVKVENGECFIPNELLQSYCDIFAYACIVDNDGQVCEFSEMFTVFARPKPDNYIYTPTEIITFKRIEDELNKKFEALAKEIEDDMKTAVRTRPQELTEEEKSQARKNIGAISSEEDRGAYYVTVTEDENGYISDRTFDDISNAINNNLFPYIIYNLSIYPWISIENEALVFGGVLDKSFTEIKIVSDNSIAIDSHNYSPDWEDQEYDDGFIKNRTHGKIVYKCDTEEKVPTSILGARELTDSQETYLQSIGANTESSKELSFVLPGYDVFYDRMSNEYDYDNYEPPNESNTKIQIAIQDSSGIITANPSFTVSEIKTNDIIYGWSFNFTDGGFAENYLKCIVMLFKNVPYNGHIRKGIWLPNYTGSPKKCYACNIEYTCIKKLEKKYIPDLGNSLPDGGTTGQVLTKNSDADGDAGWSTPEPFVINSAEQYNQLFVNKSYAEIKEAYEFGKNVVIIWNNKQYPLSSINDEKVEFVVEESITNSDDYTMYNIHTRTLAIYSESGKRATKDYVNLNVYSINGCDKSFAPKASAVLTTEQALANIGGLSKNQGTANSGKFLGIGADGIVVPTEVSGGSSEWIQVAKLKTDEDLYYITVSADSNGNELSFDEAYVLFVASKSSTDSSGNFGIGLRNWTSSFNSRTALYNYTMFNDAYIYAWYLKNISDDLGVKVEEILMNRYGNNLDSVSYYSDSAEPLTYRNKDSAPEHSTIIRGSKVTKNANGKLTTITLGADMSSSIGFKAGCYLEVFVK